MSQKKIRKAQQLKLREGRRQKKNLAKRGLKNAARRARNEFKQAAGAAARAKRRGWGLSDWAKTMLGLDKPKKKAEG